MNIKIYRNIQQRTDEWLEIKKGKTSGSGVKPVFSARSKSPWDTYAYELIAQREDDSPLHYEEGFLSAAVQWGRDMEVFAIDIFQKKYGLLVEDIGWIESEDPRFKGRAGCSPDGIIDIYEFIEVKSLSTKNHIKYITEGKLPTEFKPQILNYFIINPDLKKVYFILYDPRVKTKDKQFWVLEVMREDLEKEINEAQQNLYDFMDHMDLLYAKFLKK